MPIPAGTISQAAPGLRKHGVPANSGAVHGHRYNSLVLARHIADVIVRGDAPEEALQQLRMVNPENQKLPILKDKIGQMER